MNTVTLPRVSLTESLGKKGASLGQAPWHSWLSLVHSSWAAWVWEVRSIFRKRFPGVSQSRDLQPISPGLGKAFAFLVLSQPGGSWILAGAFSNSVTDVFTLFLNSTHFEKTVSYTFSWMNEWLNYPNSNHCPGIILIKLLKLQSAGRWKIPAYHSLWNSTMTKLLA